MADKAQVKPCPFCGSTNIRLSHRQQNDPFQQKHVAQKHYYYAICVKCLARGPVASAHTTNGRIDKGGPMIGYPHQHLEYIAIEKWNERCK